MAVSLAVALFCEVRLAGTGTTRMRALTASSPFSGWSERGFEYEEARKLGASEFREMKLRQDQFCGAWRGGWSIASNPLPRA